MTVRLANDMGMPIIVEYARRFGVYDNLMPMLSMALGAGETTLLRMVGAYGMIANGGKQISPTLIDRIQDRYGRTIWQHDDRDCVNCDAREWSGQDEPELVDDRPQIIDPMSAYQMVSIMEGVVQRGTAQKLKVLERPIAGKTGTTNDEKDGWFIGFTPDLVVGAYMGFDNPSPMGHGETGGNVSAPIVREFFRIALADQPPIPFRAPLGMKLVSVNLKTGLPAAPGDPKAIMEAFKPTQDPLGAVAIDTEGVPQEEFGQAGSTPPIPWSLSRRECGSAAVRGIPKAPGRLTVQRDSHCATNTTIAHSCTHAWDVGEHIRRVLSEMSALGHERSTPKSTDIVAVARAMKAGRSPSRAGLYWNTSCLREIHSPNFWPRETLEPALVRYKEDHPPPRPQAPPMCRESADSAGWAGTITQWFTRDD